MPDRRFLSLCYAACCVACITVIGSKLAVAELRSKAVELPRVQLSNPMMVVQDCAAARVRCEAEFNYCLSNNKDQGRCERAKSLCLSLVGCSNFTAPVEIPSGK